MKTVEIEKQKYEIQPLSLGLYAQMLGLFGRFLTECCTPTPPPEHQKKVIAEIIAHTFETIDKAKFFRPSEESSRMESNGAGPSSTSQAIGATKT